MENTKPYEFISEKDVHKNAGKFFDVLLSNNLTGHPYHVIREYTMVLYESINEWEHSQWEQSQKSRNYQPEETIAENEILSEELKKHKVRSPFWVYRALDFEYLNHMCFLWYSTTRTKNMRTLIGRLCMGRRNAATKILSNIKSLKSSLIRDPGFASTSPLKSLVEQLMSKDKNSKVLLKILIKPGTCGAGIWKISYIPEEFEFLLDRNQVFRITEVVSTTDSNCQLFVTCETVLV